MSFRLTGLIAATYTPLRDDGALALDRIEPMVAHLLSAGIAGLYVCGSTGEGMSLTGDERRAVTEATIRAVRGRVPVVVQVGHNSLFEARDLAAHAAAAGAAAISANAPSYFKAATIDLLAESMAIIAAGAPGLPFYYYHIPALTGVALDVVEFLPRAAKRIPNLVGMKYTSLEAHVFQACLELDGGRFDTLWGADEMLLSALAVGARGAVGSTYNIAAPVYHGIIEAFDAGNLAEARRLQHWAATMIRVIYRYPFHSAMKRIMGMLGIDCGPIRLPQGQITEEQTRQLRRELEAIGFFEAVG